MLLCVIFITLLNLLNINKLALISTLSKMKLKLNKIISGLFIITTLSNCGMTDTFRMTDSRKVPTNAKERVAKNLEEGKRIRFGKLGGGGSGNFEFASSNELWRATINILDFIPLENVDYGGGVVITDWYNNSENNNEYIKIMVQFLSNEIRADGLKINVYEKICSEDNTNCVTNIKEGLIGQELKLAILKKASQYKNNKIEEEAEEYRKKFPKRQSQF